jgi:hypothetical protein
MNFLPCHLFLGFHVHVPTFYGSPLPPTYDASMCLGSFLCGILEIYYLFYFANTTTSYDDTDLGTST